MSVCFAGKGSQPFFWRGGWWCMFKWPVGGGMGGVEDAKIINM